MSTHAIINVALLLIALIGLAMPLGRYMAWVYQDGRPSNRILKHVAKWFYRFSGVDPEQQMTWQHYAYSVIVFNGIGALALFAIQLLQGYLPGNPQGFAAVDPFVALNTAISFVTNTNWQAYAGEATMSHGTQMAGLTVQNFLSAGSGMAVLVAFIRGFTRHETSSIGNFWQDLHRSLFYILLPLSLLLAIGLMSQGVVQTLAASVEVQGLDAQVGSQVIALGPAASQIAIKQLGTNGGGFFNSNSAHPFENPTPLSNFLEVISILLIPAALCFTFGYLVKNKRQGWALLASMLLIFVPMLLGALAAEQYSGTLEGKEVRFGITDSVIWSAATTAASNGSVNAMHDSFSPLGGAIPMWLMQLGEIVFGGVGSGLYGLLMYAILAIFIAGLMVGRTPEYLGKKIAATEMKMASLAILLPAITVLFATALASVSEVGTAALGNSGVHGFSEMLYAFSSGANNNGSAFGGLTASGKFYTTTIALAMVIGRYGVILPVLAAAGSLARKRLVPISSGTLPTDSWLFVGLLVGTILLVGALTFIPALALGPIIEHLRFVAR